MDKFIGPKYEYDDVFIIPKRSLISSNLETTQQSLDAIALPTRDSVSLLREFKSLWHPKPFAVGVPIIAANMDHIGTMDMALALSRHQTFTALHKFYTIDDLTEIFEPKQRYSAAAPYTFVTIGGKAQDIDFLHQLQHLMQPLVINIDVANGYLRQFINYIHVIRSTFPEAIVMAGNIATGEVAAEIILAGADIVKCGIGPGSVCTTRNVTGVGYPQLSAVIECADQVHGVHGLLCADGGCKQSGDIAKALVAEADIVMLGGMLAGHQQCNGTIQENKDTVTGLPTKTMQFYGMSSEKANQKYFGGLKEYRAAEGTCIDIPYKGDVHDTMGKILGGLRSCMTLIGANKISDLKTCGQFAVRYK